MAKLKEEALAYEPQQSKNIAELEVVSVDLDVKESEEFLDSEGKPFRYKYVIKDGEKYRVPNSVLEQVKGFLTERPTMTKFKVKKSGSGLNTKYQVIPID